MHTTTIVAQVMQACLPLMHATRWCALRDVVVSAVNGHALGLVALAVGTPRTTKVRHRVKCVDRLLGNTHIEAHRFDLYTALARQWLTDLPQLLIVVDWSSLTADMQWHWLRASVVCDGRSITLYEEVHPRKHLGSLTVHTRFIKQLAQLLPKSAHPPIIMTDAGFRNPWFRLIAEQGWQWVGRVRNRDYVRKIDTDNWLPAKDLYGNTTASSPKQRARTRAAIASCNFPASAPPPPVRYSPALAAATNSATAARLPRGSGLCRGNTAAAASRGWGASPRPGTVTFAACWSWAREPSWRGSATSRTASAGGHAAWPNDAVTGGPWWQLPPRMRGWRGRC